MDVYGHPFPSLEDSLTEGLDRMHCEENENSRGSSVAVPIDAARVAEDLASRKRA
jgi:hypothetical protein